MKIKVFYPNEKGNIEITKEKLESLLNEAYNEGYRDGNNSHYYCYGNGNLTITTPCVDICSDSISGSVTPVASVTEALSNSTKDLVSIDTIQVDKISAIDCCYEAITTDTLGGTTNHAIALEYAEASNEV
jgi:hypothetical protein